MPKQNPYKKPYFLKDEASSEKEAKQNSVVSSKEYHYSDVDMEEVMKNPDEYIIPELQEACKKLWNMNIFTFMCSDRCDGGHSYILLEKLSDENQAIFDELKASFPKNFILSQFRKCIGIDFFTENMTEKEISELFVKAAERFKPQDVQKPFYITKEEFLLKCGCYKEIPNSNYVESLGPVPTNITDLKELDEYFEKSRQPKMLKIFDETKVTKPIEEYLHEKGITTYDPKTERIYRSEFFLDRHLDYVKEHAIEEESISR